MAGITSLIGAAVGLGSMVFGASEKAQGQAQMQQAYAVQQQGYQIQAQVAKQQHDLSVEQAASSVQYAGKNRDINIQAANESVAASNASAAINRNIIQQQQNLEGVKRQAMETDARRQQLEIIRNQQRSRAMALATTNAQGASRGSGLQGAYAQVSGQSGVNLLGVQQSLDVGRKTYDINANISNQNLAMNDLNNLYAQQRAATTTAMSNLTYDYAVTNAGYQTRYADTQQLMSQGQGYINQGAGMANLAQSQINSGNSFFNAGPTLFTMGQNFGNVLPTMKNYF